MSVVAVPPAELSPPLVMGRAGSIDDAACTPDCTGNPPLLIGRVGAPCCMSSLANRSVERHVGGAAALVAFACVGWL